MSTAADPEAMATRELFPGLWILPLPLPFEYLRQVFVYALIGEDGVYLIDAGWNSNDSFQALQDGLAVTRHSLADVRAILITHCHPDHIGLAERVRSASGARIGLHSAEAGLVASKRLSQRAVEGQIRQLLVEAGAGAEDAKMLATAPSPAGSFIDPLVVDDVIEDRQRLRIPGWAVEAVWTPGHTAGHLCFHLPEHRVILTGDHVLPRISPAVQVSPMASREPLRDFVTSLSKVADLGAEFALPAHERPFTDPDSRVSELRNHHRERMDEICAGLHAGSRTTWQVTCAITWSRPWDELSPFLRRAAMCEAVAHLRELRRLGRIRQIDSAPATWELTDAGAATRADGDDACLRYRRERAGL